MAKSTYSQSEVREPPLESGINVSEMKSDRWQPELDPTLLSSPPLVLKLMNAVLSIGAGKHMKIVRRLKYFDPWHSFVTCFGLYLCWIVIDGMIQLTWHQSLSPTALSIAYIVAGLFGLCALALIRELYRQIRFPLKKKVTPEQATEN